MTRLVRQTTHIVSSHPPTELALKDNAAVDLPGPRSQIQEDLEFLRAWKHAVTPVSGYFGGLEAVIAATDKDHLKPDMPVIRENLSLISTAEEAYLIALVSFVNTAHAERLVADSRSNQLIGHLAGRLSKEQRHAIAQLVVTYGGW